MPLLRVFLRATFRALLVGTLFVAAYGVYNGTVGTPTPGIGLGARVARDVIELIATLFPLSVFVGGLAVAASSRAMEGSATDRRWWSALVAVACGVAAFSLAGFVAPWIAGIVARATGGGPFAATSNADAATRTVLHWVSSYRGLLAERAAGQPVLGWMVGAAGVYFYRPFVCGALAVILFLLGTRVGARTLDLDDPRRALLYQLVAATVLLGGVAVASSFAVSAIVEHGVAAGAMMALVPAAPAIVLLALVWTDMVARPSRVTRAERLVDPA